MSAAYFGAGTDVRPIKFCKERTFHYVDSQPYSEFGILQSKEWKNGYWTGEFTGRLFHVLILYHNWIKIWQKSI